MSRNLIPDPFVVARGVKISRKRDTAEACRLRAEADLLKSVTMSTANAQQSLERSASNWLVRADLLHQSELAEQSLRKNRESGEHTRR